MSQYTNRFWQKLLLLHMMEHVLEETLQIKYEDGLQRGIQAKIHSLQPTSLFEAISYTHDAEKKINAITVWYKKANLILNKTISIVNQIASTTITCIILNHITLHALVISHHDAISMHLATHHRHA